MFPPLPFSLPRSLFQNTSLPFPISTPQNLPNLTNTAPNISPHSPFTIHKSLLFSVNKKKQNIVFKGPKFGAYTELYAALSPEITLESTRNKPGAFVIPWGRMGTVPCDIAAGLKPESEGGTGLSGKFWAWCERQTSAYMPQSGSELGVDTSETPGREEGAERV